MPRLTARGLGLLVAGVLLLGFGLLARQRDVVWPGLFLALLPLLGLIAVSASLSGRRVQRRLVPDRIPARGTVTVELDLQQSGPGLGVLHVVEEEVPTLLGPAPAFVIAPRFGERASTHRYQLTPVLRGRYPVGPLRWRTTDPLGLAAGWRSHPLISTLTVTPAVTALGAAQHSSGMGLEGEAAARRSGLVGPDDALIREYRPRDDVRRIHWPSTARVGRLMVRREDRAWDPTALILLDTRRSAHLGQGLSSSLEWSVTAAASIGLHAADAGFRVDLVDARGQSADVAAVGVQRKDALLDFLTDTPICDNPSVAELVDAAATHGRAQWVVAVLGRITIADAVRLTGLAADHQRRWAILALPPAPGSHEATQAVRVLRRHGWTVVVDGARLGVSTAWRLVASGAPR